MLSDPKWQLTSAAKEELDIFNNNIRHGEYLHAENATTQSQKHKEK